MGTGAPILCTMRYLDPDAEEWLVRRGLPEGFLREDPPVRLREVEFLGQHEGILRELEALAGAVVHLESASSASLPLLEDLQVTMDASAARLEGWLGPLYEEQERRRRFRDPDWVRSRLAAMQMPLRASAPALQGLGARVPPVLAAFKAYRQPLVAGAPFLVDRLALDKAEDAIASLTSGAPKALETHARALQEVTTLLAEKGVTLDDDRNRETLIQAIQSYQRELTAVTSHRKDTEDMVQEVKRVNKLIPVYSSIPSPEKIIVQGTAISGSLWEVSRMLEALEKQGEMVAREMSHLTSGGATQVWVSRVFQIDERGFTLTGPYIQVLDLARRHRQDLHQRLGHARQQERRLRGLFAPVHTEAKAT